MRIAREKRREEKRRDRMLIADRRPIRAPGPAAVISLKLTASKLSIISSFKPLLHRLNYELVVVIARLASFRRVHVQSRAGYQPFVNSKTWRPGIEPKTFWCAHVAPLTQRPALQWARGERSVF